MTKVYLVCSLYCKEDGKVNLKDKEITWFAFTNKKLADECVLYYNQEWKDGFTRNANFKVERIKFYYRKTMVISKQNYGGLPY